MKKDNQILLIKKFFGSDKKNIIINYVNENFEMFYLNIIKYFADQKDIKIKLNTKIEELGVETDLFGIESIQIFNINNSKKLSDILNYQNKKIIFTDYKNYRKFKSNYDCINGYQLENDITYFIKNELKIDNDELLYFCKNNPALIFSETSKYLINNNRYTTDQKLVDEKNHILNIRKLIFETKKSSLNIKNLYFYIKKEASYKKLNFLVY